MDCKGCGFCRRLLEVGLARNDALELFESGMCLRNCAYVASDLSAKRFDYEGWGGWGVVVGYDGFAVKGRCVGMLSWFCTSTPIRALLNDAVMLALYNNLPNGSIPRRTSKSIKPALARSYLL